MKIKDNRIDGDLLFKKLSAGEVFEFHKRLYMKTNKNSIQHGNAINLDSGVIAYFNQDTLINYIPNAMLIINE